MILLVGWGTNEELIISILAHRNAAQRKSIRQTYAETYEEDLLKALDKELTNDFEVSSCITTWVTPMFLYEITFSEKSKAQHRDLHSSILLLLSDKQNSIIPSNLYSC